MFNAWTIVFFLNMLLFLVVHNMKIRRYGDKKAKKSINAIFSSAILLMVIVFFLPGIWQSIIFLAINMILFSLLCFIIIRQIFINYSPLKKMISLAFEKKASMMESVLHVILLLSGFIYNFMWIASSIIFCISLLKEIFLMDEVKKKFE